MLNKLKYVGTDGLICRRSPLFLVAFGFIFLASHIDITEAVARTGVTSGQQVLYTFQEGTDTTVQDVSGVGTPLANKRVLPLRSAAQRSVAGCPAGVQSFFDEFDTLDEICRWTVLENGSGAITQASGEVTIDDPGASIDAAVLLLKEPLDRSVNFMSCASMVVDGPESGTYDMLSVIDQAGTPVLSATFDQDHRALVQKATGRFQIKRYKGGHTLDDWRETDQAWGNFSASWDDRELGDYYTICFESRADTDKWRVLGYGKQNDSATYSARQGYQNFVVTDWTPWASTESVSDTLYLAFGDGRTDKVSDQTIRIDWVIFNATPTATIPDDNWAYLNMSTSGGFPPPYEIGAFYTYDLEHPFWVPIDRDPIVLARGGVGSWNEHWNARPNVCKVSTTYYMVFDGRDAGGDTALGCATASDPEGPWTMCSNNPIIDDDGGSAIDTKFPFCQYNEGEATNKWKIWWNSETNGEEGIYYVENDCLDCATWGSSTKKLSVGASTTWDDFYVGQPTPIKVGSEWQLWYAGYDGSNWEAGCATSTTLEGTYTKCAGNPIVDMNEGQHDRWNEKLR